MKFPESAGSAPLVGPSTDPDRRLSYNQAKVDVVEKACWGLAKCNFWVVAMMPKGGFTPDYTPEESVHLWELANGVFGTAKELFACYKDSEDDDSHEKDLRDILPNLSKMSVWKMLACVSPLQALHNSGADVLEALRLEVMGCAPLFVNNTNLASPNRFIGMSAMQMSTRSPLFKATALLSGATITDYEQVLISIAKPVQAFIRAGKRWDPHSESMSGQPELALFLLVAFTLLKQVVTSWGDEGLIAKYLLPSTAIMMPVKMRQDLREDVFDFYEVPVDLDAAPVSVAKAAVINEARFAAEAAAAAAQETESGQPTESAETPETVKEA